MTQEETLQEVVDTLADEVFKLKLRNRVLLQTIAGLRRQISELRNPKKGGPAVCQADGYAEDFTARTSD